MQRVRLRNGLRAAIAAVTVICITNSAIPEVTFWTSVGPDPAGDDAWRTATAGTITEFDFEQIAPGMPIDTLHADGLEVDVDLGGFGGPSPAGQVFNSPAFVYPGVIFENTLLNRPPNTTGSEDRSDIVLRFSPPVTAFGAWMFDDQEPQLNQKRMVVSDSRGCTYVSPILDNPGIGHKVEGFIGVTTETGISITEVAIQSLDGNGDLITGAFEIDHVQVAIRACRADLDGNGNVGFEDLATMLNNWGWCEACPADMNGTGDGWVGFDDLLMLLDAWGPC